VSNLVPIHPLSEGGFVIQSCEGRGFVVRELTEYVMGLVYQQAAMEENRIRYGAGFDDYDCCLVALGPQVDFSICKGCGRAYLVGSEHAYPFKGLCPICVGREKQSAVRVQTWDEVPEADGQLYFVVESNCYYGNS